MKYSLVKADDEGYEFVNGNTKYLTKMNQNDLKVLFDNGDPRVKQEPEQKKEESSEVASVKKTEEPKPALAEKVK